MDVGGRWRKRPGSEYRLSFSAPSSAPRATEGTVTSHDQTWSAPVARALAPPAAGTDPEGGVREDANIRGRPAGVVATSVLNPTSAQYQPRVGVPAIRSPTRPASALWAVVHRLLGSFTLTPTVDPVVVPGGLARLLAFVVLGARIILRHLAVATPRLETSPRRVYVNDVDGFL